MADNESKESVRESINNAVDGKPGTMVEKWKRQISAYDREYSTWEARVDRILKRYRDENRDKSKDGGAAKFNVLWSNVQTLVPAVYSKTPKPDVSRRFRDNDPVGRVASLLLERALEFEAEHYPDFRNSMRQAVMDRFLGGRGTIWARYEPHILAVKQNLPTDGDEISEDVDAPQEELDYECAPTDYVPWKDFGHTVARTWDEVTAVWRRVYLTREACVERFGDDVGNKIPLDCVPEELKKGEMSADTAELSRACVYEIWDKLTLKAYWICKSHPEVLDEKNDPLELESFFPCPKPLYATTTNESLIPVPDFALYQDQAKELDTLADRIQGLIQSLQVKGVYDASIESLARIFTEGDNGTLIPVKNWAAFAEKNGLAGSIDIVDLKPIYEALRVCYESVQQVMQQIYDLTGISDIIRGQSNANETATAQRIKGQYASLRLKSMQTEVAVFASAALQLKAQIICGNYAPDTILKMAAAQELQPADQQLIPQAMALLIGEERLQDPVNGGRGRNPMRDFRIEVNTDTMVQIDEEEEKTKRMEFLTAMGAFMEKAMPMAEAAPQIRPLILKLWKFSVSSFKVGKTIEGEFDAAVTAMENENKQPKPPKPDPDLERVKADKEIQQMRLQTDAQSNQAKLQSDQQQSQAKLSADTQIQQMKLANEKEIAIMRANLEKEMATMKMQMEAQIESSRLQHTERVENGKRNLERETASQKNKSDEKVRMADVRTKAMTSLQDLERETDNESENGQPSAREVQDKAMLQALGALAEAMQQFAQAQQQMAKAMSAPKRLVRGTDGRAAGLETVTVQ